MNPSSIPTRTRSAPRGKTRGFTLIELMVALSGGLLFTVFVFMMARDATRFYQSESRLADATFGAIAGFQRLRNDIARAGYLSTPNIQSSRSAFCGNPMDSAMGGLQELASLQIEAGATAADPDAIVLMGSYASADQYPIHDVSKSGDNWEVRLQAQSTAMLRLGYSSGNTAPLVDLFKAGRALRIVDHTGREQYGIVQDVDVTTNWEVPVITLLSEPSFQRKDDGNSCGLRGYEAGALVNVVQMIRYDLRSLSGAAYAPLYPTDDAAVAAEGVRTELVRQELDIMEPESPLPGTAPELVAEFAVDLKFGLNVLTATDATTTMVTTDIAGYAGPVSTLTGTGPQQIRAVRARLGVRTRTADRMENVLPEDSSPIPWRVNIAPDGGYARVRTLQADIALRNQATAQ